MEKASIFCPGKINLSLNILGRRGDGYHYIDSVMQAIPFGDTLIAAVRNDNQVNISFEGEGAIGIGADNSVQKTVALLKSRFGEFGADILVQKQLPLAGGLGGSSANAAGALVLLSRLFGFFDKNSSLKSDKSESGKIYNTKAPSQILKAASSIGSDVCFLTGVILGQTAARVSGVGEIITPANGFNGHLVIAKIPNTAVSSADSYKLFDSMFPSFFCSPADNDNLIAALKNGEPSYRFMHNALQTPSEHLCPDLLKTKSALYAAGANHVMLSGSGACYIGFFDAETDAFKAASCLLSNGFWSIYVNI